MKTVAAAYQTKTDLLQKAPAYKVVAYNLTGGVPSGTERAFSRDFATGPLQAQTGTKLVCLDAPGGNVQTLFPEQGQSSIGSFTFPLYDRDGEVTRQIGNPKKGLNGAITASVPANGGNLDLNATTAGYTSRGAVQVDSEIILYTGKATNQLTGITRGAHGTTAASHANGATVHNWERLQLGTRLQLFAGYADLDEADFASFAKMEVVDVRMGADLIAYEVVCADVQRFTRARIFTGATANAPVAKTGNPVTLALQALLSSGTAGKNHATYDIGDGNGLDMSTGIVDVAGLESLRDTEFPGNSYTFSIKEPKDAKPWLEKEIWQTLNCVPFITQDGKYSAKRLKNAGSTVGSITDSHVIKIVGWRKATDRVINVLDFRYDFDITAAPNEFGKRRIYLMDSSIAKFGRRPALVIESQGIKSASGGDAIADNRAQRVADRWAEPPDALELDLFYEKHLFDIGDQVAVTVSQVPNPQTGLRGLTAETFEVLDIRPIFDPTAQAGMHVTLLWLGSVTLPSAPSSTTQTPTPLDRDTTAPATPTGLAVSPTSEVLADGTFIGILDATWAANAEADLSHYVVRWRKQGTAAYAYEPSPKQASPRQIIRGLQPNTIYDLSVQALDSSLNPSAFATDATPTTPANPGAPAVPTGLGVSSFPMVLAVVWSANAESDIIRYELQTSTTGAFGGEETTVFAGLSTHFLHEVGPSVQRWYRIRAVRRSGVASGFSTSVNATSGQVNTADIAALAVVASKINVAILSAITADVGTLTAGLLRNAGDTSRFDLTNERLRIRSSDAVSTRRFMVGDEAASGNYLYFDSATGKLALGGDILARKLDSFGRAIVFSYSAEPVARTVLLPVKPDFALSYVNRAGASAAVPTHIKIPGFAEGNAFDGGAFTTPATNSLKNFWPSGLSLGTDADINPGNIASDFLILSGLLSDIGCRCRAKIVTYTGNETIRSITGVGFQPDFVIIFQATSTMSGTGNGPPLRGKSESSTNNRYLGSGADFPGTGITSLDSDGFSLGAHRDVNMNTQTFDALCIKSEFPPSADVGLFWLIPYVGNGVDSRDITDSRYGTPDMVFIFSDNLSQTPVYRTKSCSGDDSRKLGSSSQFTNAIQGFVTNGFQVGTDADVNTNTRLYTAWCFRNL